MMKTSLLRTLFTAPTALALALLVSSLYRLARVAGDHTRFEQRHQRDATSET